VLGYGGDLEADHPGFTDEVYRARRAEITNLAKTYKHGMPLPRVHYTDKEIATWAVVFDKLTGLYKTHACKEHQYVFPLLVQNCGFRRGKIKFSFLFR
jgi:phenylalanine-4-hydroxylase